MLVLLVLALLVLALLVLLLLLLLPLLPLPLLLPASYFFAQGPKGLGYYKDQPPRHNAGTTISGAGSGGGRSSAAAQQQQRADRRAAARALVAAGLVPGMDIEGVGEEEKSQTAARHTYDVGYGKWDKVLKELDRDGDGGGDDLD